MIKLWIDQRVNLHNIPLRYILSDGSVKLSDVVWYFGRNYPGTVDIGMNFLTQGYKIWLTSG